MIAQLSNPTFPWWLHRWVWDCTRSSTSSLSPSHPFFLPVAAPAFPELQIRRGIESGHRQCRRLSIWILTVRRANMSKAVYLACSGLRGSCELGFMLSTSHLLYYIVLYRLDIAPINVGPMYSVINSDCIGRLTCRRCWLLKAKLWRKWRQQQGWRQSETKNQGASMTSSLRVKLENMNMKVSRSLTIAECGVMQEDFPAITIRKWYLYIFSPRYLCSQILSFCKQHQDQLRRGCRCQEWAAHWCRPHFSMQDTQQWWRGRLR